jgi:phosphatidylglycerol:prolipoprotein diacylglycerol transferase
MENRAARRRAASATRRATSRSKPVVGSPGPSVARPASTTTTRAGETVASDAVEPEALVVTHWFDPGEDGEPYSATLRLTGQRVGISGRPTARDTFVHEETIDDVIPGSGPLSISSWIYGLEPGEWNVSADPIRPPSRGRGHGPGDRRDGGTKPLRAAWSWRRWAISSGPALPVKTRWALPAPLARIPAVIPGSWTALGSLAVVVAVATQAAILAHENIAVGPALVVSMLAVLFGLVGAKVWYAVLHPGPWRQALLGGWAVDGFLFVAVPVAVVALLAFNLPIGTYLDASTPGIFFGVAIGRVGCFLTGCCAGRCTRSRWGLWSSDRRVGARRIPAQLIESGAGLLIGGVSMLLVLGHLLGADGVIFVAAFGTYVVVRQLLLRLRAERREYSWRRSGSLARQG